MAIIAPIRGAPGAPGAPGATGPQGPAGQGAGEFEFLQTVPATTWTVVHNLGRHPAGITVYDTSNDVCEGSVEYQDDNTIILTFSAPFSGRVKIV